MKPNPRKVSAKKVMRVATVFAGAGAFTAAFAPAAVAAPLGVHPLGQYVGQTRLQDKANNECLNGALGTGHAELTLGPCHKSDTHSLWGLSNVHGGAKSDYLFIDKANGKCLNGADVTSHAELTLGSCKSANLHSDWYKYKIGVGGNATVWQDVANGLCLNGANVTSHAELTLTTCNSTDKHMWWASESPLFG